jgi:uncharacterized protein
MDEPFWRRKALGEMTEQEWESLCDGCARCCLVKLNDEETDEVHLTRLACRLLDHGTCRCSAYARRHELMPDCVAIDPATVASISWMPPTCAYRLVGEGKDLPWWHPLVSGDRETVHQAGISVRGWALSEARVRPEDMERFIVRDFGQRTQRSPRRRKSG